MRIIERIWSPFMTHTCSKYQIGVSLTPVEYHMALQNVTSDRVGYGYVKADMLRQTDLHRRTYGLGAYRYIRGMTYVQEWNNEEWKKLELHS